MLSIDVRKSKHRVAAQDYDTENCGVFTRYNVYRRLVLDVGGGFARLGRSG